MNRCPHCITGFLANNYDERLCINCGYREYEPRQITFREWQERMAV